MTIMILFTMRMNADDINQIRSMYFTFDVYACINVQIRF